MNTSLTTTNNSGMTFWKILGIIAVVLLGLALIGSLIKGLFWLGVAALALYGGYMLIRSNKTTSNNGTTSL